LHSSQNCLKFVSCQSIQLKQEEIRDQFCRESSKTKRDVIICSIRNALRTHQLKLVGETVSLTFQSLFPNQVGHVDLCEHCYFVVCLVKDVFGVSWRTWGRMKSKLKRDKLFGDAHSQQPTPSVRHQGAMSQSFTNLARARIYFNNQNFFVSEHDLRLAYIPDKDSNLKALLWMEDFFNTTADKSHVGDNRVELNGLYSYSGIYELFKKFCEENDEASAVVSYTVFRSVWKRCFPNVRIKKYLSVNGKCEVCALIYDRKEHFRKREDAELSS
jgi:hypothetical protein